MPKSDLYERDFYGWTRQQAALLRVGSLVGADIEEHRRGNRKHGALRAA